MGKTIWVADATPRRSWLLTDGSVIQSPELEVTAGGRRVRLKDDPGKAMYSADVDALLLAGAQTKAAQRGAKLWMPAANHDGSNIDETILHELEHTDSAPWALSANPAKLHFTSSGYQDHTVAAWKFQHPSIPELTAYLRVALKKFRYHGRAYTVSVDMEYPDTQAEREYIDVLSYSANHQVWPGTGAYDIDQKMKKLVRPDWLVDLPVDQLDTELTARKAVRALAECVRVLDDVDTVHVPDLRDLDEIGFLQMDLVESNIHGEFISSITDYLDNGPLIDEAREHYEAFVSALRKAGVVVDLDHDDHLDGMLARALSGNVEELNVSIGPVAEAADQNYQMVDQNHTVTTNLATGVVVVTCNHRDVNQDEVVTQWELAKVKAQLTGEEDELLTYARAYAQKKGQDRVKKILRDHC